MSYGLAEYAGAAFAGPRLASAGEIPVDEETILSIEIAFTSDALDPAPVWVDVTADVRWWDTLRGRNRELERMQPGRLTVILGNLDRQYDSKNAAGPYFGNLKPMRRIRVRETFNGVTFPVFDGYVDKWLLDYPGTNKDATATVIATDAFKIWNRTDLGLSVYTNEVATDAPRVWYRLDDDQGVVDATAVVLNNGTDGSAKNGTAVGNPRFGGQGLVGHDPGTAMVTSDSVVNPGTPNQGVTRTGFGALIGTGPWALEAWVRPEVVAADATGDYILAFRVGPGLGVGAVLAYLTSGGNQIFGFSIVNDTSTTYSVVSAAGQTPWKRYHLVVKHGPDRVLSLYVNGVKTTGGTTTGAMTLHNELLVAHNDDIVTPGARNWRGTIQDVAIYTAAAGVDPLSDARIAAHYAAGTAPWQGDLPGARIGRALDLADWPSALRELDPGATTLQSAAIDGQTTLEHSQKTQESEFGLFFVSRAGDARFISRAAVFGRALGPLGVGDGIGEIGYRDIKFDDGDSVIRNRATVSRLNGVAEASEDAASVDEFGRFDYVLDGLLHDSDAHSFFYAEFVVEEFAQPRRRVTSLSLGPARVGSEATLYPLMLGAELGDIITVLHRPPGSGDAFQQNCAIEGIKHTSTPGGDRTATFILSPDYAGSF